ncbi:hypothetical protein TB2_011980 [Malus domestica]
MVFGVDLNVAPPSDAESPKWSGTCSFGGSGDEHGSSLGLNVGGSGSRTGWNKQIVRKDHVSNPELSQHVGEEI